MRAWSPRRCHCCNGSGVIDPIQWPISRRDRRDAAIILAIESSNSDNIPAVDMESAIAESIDASEKARIVAIAAVYASKWDGDDYGDDNIGYIEDVYADAASMIETGWPTSRSKFAAAVAELFEHGEVVVDGGRARLAR